jgi:hypothetical protein
LSPAIAPFLRLRLSPLAPVLPFTPLLEERKTVEETSFGSGGELFENLSGSLRWFELAGYKFKNPKLHY